MRHESFVHQWSIEWLNWSPGLCQQRLLYGGATRAHYDACQSSENLFRNYRISVLGGNALAADRLNVIGIQ
jgi:hypothetical protein